MRIYANCTTFAPLFKRGVAQLVSAPGLGPGGPPFESGYPDNRKDTEYFYSVFFYARRNLQA